MNSKKFLSVTAAAILAIFSAQISQAQTQTAQTAPKKTAVFVRNDSADKTLDAKAKALEFAISARLNTMGFAVVNHDLAMRNLNDYLGNPNAKYLTQAAAIKKALDAKPSPDSALFSDASALRAAEILGTDYILSVSYASLGKSERVFEGYGINTRNTLYTLRSNYNLYTSSDAAGTVGGTVSASATIRATQNFEEISDDVLNALIADTAEKTAIMIKAQNDADMIAKNAALERGSVEILFSIEEMSFPEVTVDSEGRYVLGSNIIPATIPHVTASIDGLATSIGGKISLSKGLHTVKISQTDLERFDMNIYVTPGIEQSITLPLSLTQAARERWKENLVFLETIKERAKKSDNERILTQAEAEKLKGIAKAFRNSGYKINVNAKEFPQINRVQSIFAQ